MEGTDFRFIDDVIMTVKWHLTSLDTHAWAPRGSSSSRWNPSGMARAAPRICKRCPLISDPPSGNRCPRPGSNTFPATLSPTTTKCSTPPQCSVPCPRGLTGTAARLDSMFTSPWPEETPLFPLWKWPSGSTPTSKYSLLGRAAFQVIYGVMVLYWMLTRVWLRVDAVISLFLNWDPMLSSPTLPTRLWLSTRRLRGWVFILSSVYIYKFYFVWYLNLQYIEIGLRSPWNSYMICSSLA